MERSPPLATSARTTSKWRNLAASCKQVRPPSPTKFASTSVDNMLRTSSAFPRITARSNCRSRCRFASAAHCSGKNSTISRMIMATTSRSFVRRLAFDLVSTMLSRCCLLFFLVSPPTPPVFVALSVDAAENVFRSNSLKNRSRTSSNMSSPACAAFRRVLAPSRISSTTFGDVEKHVCSKWLSLTIAPFTMDTNRSRYTQPRSPHFVRFRRPIGARRKSTLHLLRAGSAMLSWRSMALMLPATSFPSNFSTKSNWWTREFPGCKTCMLSPNCTNCVDSSSAALTSATSPSPGTDKTSRLSSSSMWSTASARR
mmetsp:Transcript_34128/g.98402  ORF Transcript_34128/g.98402 Transcript_34128/m.98402 type:complete len:313 (-) Transcript_34128:648-1586(-)